MKPTAELITLVDKCLSQKLSRVEMAQLEQLLEDDANLSYYLGIADVEGAIPYALGAGVMVQSSQSSEAGLLKRIVRPLSLAAAAVIIFSTGVYIGSPPADQSDISAHSNSDHLPLPPESGGKAAAITSLVGVTWENEAPESIQLTKDSDAIAFESGIVEISFKSGVRSLVEGPAMIRITGDNSAILDRGRMVTEVPKGAEGFTVEYPDGKVVDLGTEFAMHVPQNQHGAEVGVFRGEVEIYDRKQNIPLKILENHAVVQIAGSNNPFASIPFHRDQFIRELPSSEFPWKLSEAQSQKPNILEFDVSHLVWRSGTYRTILKYMHGSDGLHIHKAELLLNDQIICSDVHLGTTGVSLSTRDNSYVFDIPESKHQKGQWTVRVTADPSPRGKQPAGTFSPNSSGIMIFKDPRTTKDTHSSFIGTWEYQHNGDIHRRVFTADHRAEYYFNGKKTAIFNSATWEIKDGVLILNIEPHRKGDPATHQELHLLKNEKELIFVNRPYRNALKVE